MEPHKLATVLVPGDFVVLHADGSIDCTPRGIGHRDFSGRDLSPMADLAYIPKWKLSMLQFPNARRECQDAIRQRIRGINYFGDHIEKYLQHVGAMTIAAAGARDYSPSAEVYDDALRVVSLGANPEYVTDWLKEHKVPLEPYRDQAVEAARKELAHVFPQTDFSNLVQAGPEFPFVKLDKPAFNAIIQQQLQKRFDALSDNEQSLKVAHEMRDYARKHLGGITSTETGRKMVQDMLNFPQTLKEKSFRPLLYCAVTDPRHVIKVSPGINAGYFNPYFGGSAGIAYWNNLSKALEVGTETISPNIRYSANDYSGRKLPEPLNLPTSMGGRNEDQRYIVMEEKIHAGLDSLFANMSMPYGGYENKAERNYTDAVSKDINSKAKLEMLGLEAYNPKSYGVEAVAKVMVYAEKEGMAAARKEFPRIMKHVEGHVLPAAIKRCKEMGINTERGINTKEWRVDSPHAGFAGRTDDGSKAGWHR